MKEYFVIYQDDKEATVMNFDKKGVIDFITEYNDHEYLKDIPCLDPVEWGMDAVLIIKGKIVQPKTKQKIVEYDIE
jgi:hypothetical protein